MDLDTTIAKLITRTISPGLKSFAPNTALSGNIPKFISSMDVLSVASASRPERKQKARRISSGKQQRLTDNYMATIWLTIRDVMLKSKLPVLSTDLFGR